MNGISAISAAEISSPVSGSGIAHGYSMRTHDASSMLAIAARTREFSGIPTENLAPALETACRMDEEQ